MEESCTWKVLRMDQVSKSGVVLEFWALIGTILLWYCVDLSTYGASGDLEGKVEGDGKKEEDTIIFLF